MDFQEHIKEALYDHIQVPSEKYFGELILMSDYLKGRRFLNTEDLRVTANQGRNKYGEVDLELLVSFYFGEVWAHVQSESALIKKTHPWLTISPSLKIKTFLEDKIENLADIDPTGSGASDAIQQAVEIDFDEAGFDSWFDEYVDEEDLYRTYLADNGFVDEADAEEGGGLTEEGWIVENRGDYYVDFDESDKYQEAQDEEYERVLKETDWDKGSIVVGGREFEDEYDEICNELLGVDFDGHSLSSTFDDTYLDSLEEPTVVIKYDASGEKDTIAWSELLEGGEISKTPFTVESVQLPFDPTSKVFFDFAINLDCEVSQAYSEEFSTIQRTIPMVQSFKDQIADSIQKKQTAFDFFKEANTVLPIQVSSSFNYNRELYVEDFTETKKEVDTIGDLRAYFEDTFTIDYTVIPSSVAIKGEWVLKSPNPDDVINLKFPPFSQRAPSSPSLTVVSAKAETLRVNIPAPTILATTCHYEFVLWLDLTFKGTVEVVRDLETSEEYRIVPNIKVNADLIESSAQGVFFLYVDSDYNFDMGFSEISWHYILGLACTFEFAMSGLSRIEGARQKRRFRLIADHSDWSTGRYVVDFRWAQSTYLSNLEVHHNSKNKPIFIGKSKKWFGGGSWLDLPKLSKEKNVFPLVEDGSLRRDFPDTNPYGLIGAKSWRPKDHSVNVVIKKNTNFIAQSLLWLWYPNVLSRFGEHGKNFEYLLNAPLGTILTTIYDEVVSPQDFMKRFLGPQHDSLAQNVHQLSTEAAAVFGTRELVFDPTTTSETQNKYFLTQSLMRFIYSFCDFYTKPLAILHNFLTIDKSMNEYRSNPLLKDKFGIASSISIKEANENWLPTYREALSASQKDTSWSILMVKDNPQTADLEKEIDLWEEHAVVFEFIEAAEYLNGKSVNSWSRDIQKENLPPDFYAYLKDNPNQGSPANTYNNLRSNLTKEVSSYTDKFGRQEVSTFSSQLTSSLLWLVKFWTYDIATMLIDRDFLDTDFYQAYLKGGDSSVMHVLDLAYLLEYPTWSTAMTKLSKNKTVTVEDGEKKPVSIANLQKNIMAYVPIRQALISTTRTKSKLGSFPNEQDEKATQAERLSLTAFLEIFNIIKLAYSAYTRYDTRDLAKTFGPVILTHEPFLAIQSTGFEAHGKLVGVESAVKNASKLVKKRMVPLSTVYKLCIGLEMYSYLKNAMREEKTQVVNFFNTAYEAPKNLSGCVYYTGGKLVEAKAYSNLIIGAVGNHKISADSLHFILNSILYLRDLNPELYETSFKSVEDLYVPARSVLPAFYAWANITKVEHADNIGLGEKFMRVIANSQVLKYWYNMPDTRHVADIKHLCVTYGDVLDCSPFHIRNENVYSGKSEDFAGGEPLADVAQLAQVLVKAFIQEPTISWAAKCRFLYGAQPQDMLPPLFLPVLYDILMEQDEQFYEDYLSVPRDALSGIFNITDYEALLNWELKSDANSAGRYNIDLNMNHYSGEYEFNLEMLTFNPETPLPPVAT